jgi:isatin hydrolase
VDCRPLRGQAAPGESPLITSVFLEAWERENGRLREGDVVLLHTGWTDDTYHRFPEGKAFGHDVVIDKSAPGWPAPDVPAMHMLADRGILTLGVDTGSTGSLQDDPGPHWAGLGRGMVFIERLTNLHRLPTRGAGFVFLGLKLEGGSGAAGRAIGLVAR